MALSTKKYPKFRVLFGGGEGSRTPVQKVNNIFSTSLVPVKFIRIMSITGTETHHSISRNAYSHNLENIVCRNAIYDIRFSHSCRQEANGSRN